LLYRAGWAACEARFASLKLAPSKAEEGLRSPGAGGGIDAAWSAASAAIAASLAVILTLQWRPIADRDVASKSSEVRPAVSNVTTSPTVPKSAPSEFKHAALAKPNPPRFPAGLLALRRQTLTNAWAKSASIASTSGDPAPTPEKTARELMNEYVPPDSGRLNGIWLWSAAPQGDSI
jgi:hypothetical protein